MTCFAFLALFASLTTADAVAILLNSSSATGARTYAEARAKIEAEAREGKALQQFVIGLMTDDKALAAKYLDAARGQIRTLAEKRDNALAWYLLSMEKNDIDLLRRAASGGNVQALNALGSIAATEAFNPKVKLEKEARDRILRKSYDCFRQASAKRDPNGFINLGTCLLRGLGCRQDMGLAFQCFKAAAEAGHPEGMDNMSACYQFGHGVEKNNELCLLWAMRGRAARGDEAAATWLRDRK